METESKTKWIKCTVRECQRLRAASMRAAGPGGGPGWGPARWTVCVLPSGLSWNIRLLRFFLFPEKDGWFQRWGWRKLQGEPGGGRAGRWPLCRAWAAASRPPAGWSVHASHLAPLPSARAPATLSKGHPAPWLQHGSKGACFPIPGLADLHFQN